ncbi:unnamed protein product [Notodromas monacha]|uniref:Cuticle protein n=1 Tax=Notodromas monacha TaxID=399045 RepID=A0A7R9BCN5_9CRUS|nr:unnamed protein product [Notodromas monacha]CAG0912857.1 unnamed protein product [Notodromas monacha]
MVIVICPNVIAILAALVAVAVSDIRPSYGKAYRPAVYKPVYKPAYAPAAYAPAPYYPAASSYEPAYVPAPTVYKPAYKPAGYGKDEYYNDNPQYQFQWAVRDDYSGNDYNHAEQRDGYKTQGEYKTLLPDGRYQIVSYTADEYGYNANVNYEGEAKYDSYKPSALIRAIACPWQLPKAVSRAYYADRQRVFAFPFSIPMLLAEWWKLMMLAARSSKRDEPGDEEEILEQRVVNHVLLVH